MLRPVFRRGPWTADAVDRFALPALLLAGALSLTALVLLLREISAPPEPAARPAAASQAAQARR